MLCWCWLELLTRWVHYPNLGNIYQSYHRDHDEDSGCNRSPGVCMKISPFRAKQDKYNFKRMLFISGSLFLHQKYLKTMKKINIYIYFFNNSHSQRPPRLCERPPGGGTTAVEKPCSKQIIIGGQGSASGLRFPS